MIKLASWLIFDLLVNAYYIRFQFSVYVKLNTNSGGRILHYSSVISLK